MRPSDALAEPVTVARAFRLGGRVQGVGFRPFVYRIAARHRVSGWVRNAAGEVEVMAEGAPDDLDRFAAALITQAPPLARPLILADAPVAPAHAVTFRILASDASATARVHLPPDQFCCDDCLAELTDPTDRRFRYPFINCTQCGPRYTLIARLPYDRANTSMADFAMCSRCAAEYADPADRRFHAEPIACPDCGPKLEFHASDQPAETGEAALAAAIAVLRAGGIVAAKGIGGYHLLCDAASTAAVKRLRARKHRPDKPLAVMFPPEPDLAAVRRAALLDPVHEAMLRDPIRPVVLMPKRPESSLAPELAPGSGDIGAMLPYSPLHHLLLSDFAAPLVATSGNVSGEPVLTDNGEAETRLASIADGFLHHDRPIVRPADDPVVRVVAGRARPLRLGRGNAPTEIALPFALGRPVLALGGHLKNTVALGWGNRAVVSPHLGDMDTARGFALMQSVAADLQALYGVRAEAVACDAHPGYATTRLARRMGLPVIPVFHHEAHAAALLGEQPLDGDALVFAWDGAGFGRDGAIWGGEALIGRPGRWRRVATMRPFALLGGERAAREPWRSALALCFETGRDWGDCPRPPDVLHHAWQRKLNCPPTSSVGRLFDAAAAFLGLIVEATYEGQAPAALEALAHADADPVPLPRRRRDDGVWEGDWGPLVDAMLDETCTVAARASVFHASLAELLLAEARAIKREFGVATLGLTGGVFQNRVLAERVAAVAARDGFSVLMPEALPCNDAGLSFGQLVEAGAAP